MCEISQKLKQGVDSGSVFLTFEKFLTYCHSVLIMLRDDDEDDEDNDGDHDEDKPVEDDEHDGDHVATHPLNHQVDILTPSFLLLQNTGNIFQLKWNILNI